MSGLFENLPPELQAQLEEQRVHRQMHVVENVHSLHRFIDELEKDQLLEFDRILGSVLGSKANNWYIRALIVAKLDNKYQFCPCGESHNPEDATPPKSELVKDLDLRYSAGEMPWWDGDQFNVDIFLLKCEEWGVTPASPWDREGDYKVICIGCSMEYQSLQDRMLRKPKIEGCHGCQHKSAHG